MEPNSPAFIRACWATLTFSSALMVLNRRMFWNVRATPSAVILSGRLPVMSRPSNDTRPAVGL